MLLRLPNPIRPHQSTASTTTNSTSPTTTTSGLCYWAAMERGGRRGPLANEQKYKRTLQTSLFLSLSLFLLLSLSFAHKGAANIISEKPGLLYSNVD